MPDADVLALVELIAQAIRDELGEEIDAYPGFRAPERSDPINRAFRAVVAAILNRNLAHAPQELSPTLRLIAERRLVMDAFDALLIKRLLDEEPGSPDDWMVFLILSSRQQVTDVFRPDDSDLA